MTKQWTTIDPDGSDIWDLLESGYSVRTRYDYTSHWVEVEVDDDDGEVVDRACGDGITYVPTRQWQYAAPGADYKPWPVGPTHVYATSVHIGEHANASGLPIITLEQPTKADIDKLFAKTCIHYRADSATFFVDRVDVCENLVDKAVGGGYHQVATHNRRKR